MQRLGWNLGLVWGLSAAIGCTSGTDPDTRQPRAPVQPPRDAGPMDAARGDGAPEDGGSGDAGGPDGTPGDAHADSGDTPAPLPNLAVHVERTQASMYFEPRGMRRALTFQVEVENTGPGDLVLGDPASSAYFEDISCDGSRGLDDFIAWTVRNPEGAILSEGTLPALCVADAEGGAFSCAHQGLSAGQRTVQPTSPYCAFADVTDLAPGEYSFEVTVNPEGAIAEETLVDNHAVVPFAVDEHDVCREGFCGTACCYDDPCAGGACDHLPDLAPYPGRSSEDVYVTATHFAPDSCAILEECVGGPGERRLLRFSSTIANYGPGDLAIGRPQDHPDLFEWDACHRHYHFIDFASYQLLHEDGTVAAEGHKQSFCLFDALPVTDDAGPPQFTCGFQGISAGWGDVYRVGLDCQWIDITGVSPGRYLIEVVVNGEQVIEEYDPTNNVERLPVYLYPDGTACAPGDLPAGTSCPPIEP